LAESTIDIDALVAPLSDEEPCGESLEYDAAYLELTQVAQGTPEREVGDSFVPAEPPDWKDIRQRSLEMLSRSRDLSLCVHLLSAQVATHGWEGVRDVLVLIRRLLEERWEHVYPRLDPDDGDPTMRVNVVAEISPAPGAVPATIHLIQRLRQAPLTDSPQLGRIGLREYAIANGDIAPPKPREGEEPEPLPEMATITAASLDTPLEALSAFSDAIKASLEEIDTIDTILKERVGAGNAPDFSELESVLKDAGGVISEWLIARGAAADEALMGQEGEGGGAGGAPAASGEIRSRDDVIRTFDRILRYFEIHEPTSPVPMLIRRAQRLIHKSFSEIVEDMAPDAMSTLQVISGDRPEE